MRTRVIGPGFRGWLVGDLRDGVWWEAWGDGYRVSVWSVGVLIESIEFDDPPVKNMSRKCRNREASGGARGGAW